MASVPLAILSPEDAARVRAAQAPVVAAYQAADRLRMRLEGAKATLLDADDAFRAVFHPICAAHGVDPSTPMRLLDDGTLVPADTKPEAAR